MIVGCSVVPFHSNPHGQRALSLPVSDKRGLRGTRFVLWKINTHM